MEIKDDENLNITDLPDVQNRNGNYKVKINEIGINSLRMPIVILEKNGDKQNTIGQFEVVVDLEKDRKGTHMSRIIRIVNDGLDFEKYLDVFKLFNISKEMTEKLESNYCRIKVSFPYFIKKFSPVSRISSEVVYDCFIEFEYNKNGNVDSTIGCSSIVTTVCPCSLEISDIGAHNQRAKVNVSIKTGHYDAIDKIIWIEDIIRIIEESGSCDIHTVLKREDEKYVTEKMFNNPKFAEDVTRDTFLKIKEMINYVKIKHILVESESFESIHNHNVICKIEQGED